MLSSSRCVGRDPFGTGRGSLLIRSGLTCQASAYETELGW